MRTPARMLAAATVVVGLIVMAIGVVNMQRAVGGQASLQAVYEAQNVSLSYNEDGVLVDRGTPEGAEAIMSLLRDDWKYPVDMKHFDSSDPLVNTPSELMFQYATISYHVLHGTQTVVLTEDAEYNGEVFPAGTYEFEVDGRYWTDFDRRHPLEGPARTQAWQNAHGLLASISSGATADMLAGFAHFAAWRTMLIGLGIALAGGAHLAGISRKEGMQAEIEMAKTTRKEEPIKV